MKYRSSTSPAVVGLVAATALVLSGCTSTDRVVADSVVSVAVTQAFTSTNPLTNYGSRGTNGAIGYATNSQFAAYDDTSTLVRDESFGTMEAVSQDPFAVQYTIADGVTWSDGEPVDAADLLLSWAANSAAVNSADFDDADYVDEESGRFTSDVPDDVVYFDGQSSNGLQFATATPTVGDDGRSIVVAFDDPLVDWELAFTMGPPAHVVADLAWEEPDAQAAKDAVVEAILDGDDDALAPLSRQWNDAFNIDGMPENDALLVSSGPYTVTDVVGDERVELTANPEYTGEHRPVFETVEILTVADPLASVQALADGTADVVAPQATADVQSALLAVDGATIMSGSDSTWEHLDLQFDDSRNDLFDDERVRRAFLLSVPREQIVADLIAPIQEDAVVRSSFTLPPGSPAYSDAVQQNGSSDYAAVDIPAAKRLLAEAKVTEPEVCVLFSSVNPRRVQQFQLIQESAAQAGFVVTDCSAPDIVPVLGQAGAYDAALFGWNSRNTSVAGTVATYHSTDGINNLNRYDNPDVDALLDSLADASDDDARTELLIDIDAALWADAYGLPLFQHPSVTAFGPSVAGVTGSPLPPGVFWNVWDWEPAA